MPKILRFLACINVYFVKAKTEKLENTKPRSLPKIGSQIQTGSLGIQIFITSGFWYFTKARKQKLNLLFRASFAFDLKVWSIIWVLTCLFKPVHLRVKDISVRWFREQSPLGKVSLYSWSPVLQVWIQLLQYIQNQNILFLGQVQSCETGDQL